MRSPCIFYTRKLYGGIDVSFKVKKKELNRTKVVYSTEMRDRGICKGETL